MITAPALRSAAGKPGAGIAVSIVSVAVVTASIELLKGPALEAGVPVDARIERGRTATHALQRLWEVEPFDEILVPAPVGSHAGFTLKELAWMLAHAPAETIVLRPAPDGAHTRQ